MKRVILLAIFVSMLSSLTACDEAVKSYKETLARKETEAINKIFSVAVTDLKRNEDNGRSNLELIFDLSNQSMENITEIKGNLELRDVRDELIKTEMFDYKKRLRGGHKLQGLVFVVTGSNDRENYEKTNGFDLDKGNFKLEFLPDVVVFDSGKVLRRRISD